MESREQAQPLDRFTQYAIDRVGIACYWIMPNARITYVNQAAMTSLGYSQEELQSMTIHDIDPNFPPPAWPAHWEDLRKRRSFTLRTQHLSKDKRLFPVEVTVNYVVFDGKEFNCAFVRDITDLVKAELQANEWKERYEAAVLASGQILYDWNPQTQQVIYGGALNTILGHTLDEATGDLSRWLGWIHPDDRERFSAERARALETQSPFNLEYRVQRKNGEYIDCTDKGYWMASKGAAGRMVGFIVDVTERKQMERRVVRSEKLSAVGQLAAGVAHEINNPLGVILGFAEVALDDLSLTGELQKVLQSIEREAQRCRRLVQDLLIFSRDSKPGTAFESPVEVIEGALSLVETQTRMRNVEIRREFEAPLPKLNIDRGQIQQVIINLCTNAIDAMPKGGVLTIHLAQVNDTVEIRVADTGTGVSPEIQQKIFEPFFTTKAVGQGTGLGLSLAYEIIKKHHGQIDLKSEIGKGTTFIIRLPVSWHEDGKVPLAA